MTIEFTRPILAAALLGLVLSAACSNAGDESARIAESESTPALTVYHDPRCGCCGDWASHMREHGFEVTAIEDSNIHERRRELGVPDRLASCHTATVAGYLIEGHVPAADVRRLLAQRPDARGLSVPGMPLGSPGMEHGDRRQAYNVLLFDDAGNFEVFNHYPAR